MEIPEPLFYDRMGRPISLIEWAEKVCDNSYKHIARTMLPNGLMVTTEWLGLDNGWGKGPPLIFQTMVYSNEDIAGERACERYSTLEEAQAGHILMVAAWSHWTGHGDEAAAN